MSVPKQILVIGDSHAKGFLPHTRVDSDAIAVRLGSTNRMRLAISGSTAVEWAADKDGRLTKAQGAACACDAALISLMGNDLFAAAADGKIEMHEVAAAAGALYEVVRSVSMIAPRTFVLLYGYPYRDGNARNMLALMALDASITAVADTVAAVTGSRIETIDEREILKPEDWPGDDIHPFESGYVRIAEEILRRMGQ